MKRELVIAGDGSISIEDRTLEIDLGSTRADALALELMLVQEAMVESLTLRDAIHGRTVKLHKGDVFRAVIEKHADHRTHVILSHDELGSWIAFLLQYYRDGVAPVNHLDIEAKGDAAMDIVLRVPEKP